eukprot:3932568-Rhodomonas_salina.2
MAMRMVHAVYPKHDDDDDDDDDNNINSNNDFSSVMITHVRRQAQMLQLLRLSYAMSGTSTGRSSRATSTKISYAATRPLGDVRLRACYEMSGTDVAYAAIIVSACHVGCLIPGTELACRVLYDAWMPGTKQLMMLCDHGWFLTWCMALCDVRYAIALRDARYCHVVSVYELP